jgi:hypothetical protein
MILKLILLTCLYAADSSTMFDLPPVIMDDTPVKGAPNSHTTIFNPIADVLEEVEIEPTYFTWNWNASQIFPDLAPAQFSQAMQSLKDYGLHIVDAADIAHHLKFANFSVPIPWDIAQVFNNPMHIVTIVISCIIILFLVYKLFQA